MAKNIKTMNKQTVFSKTGLNNLLCTNVIYFEPFFNILLSIYLLSEIKHYKDKDINKNQLWQS